jgi:hypothetical protein
MAIELFAVDLDGTLLNSSKQLTLRSYEAIERARRLGIRVVISSARPPRTVQPLYDRLGLQTVQINYNGAMVWDPIKDELLLHRTISAATARTVIERAREHVPQTLVSIETLDRWCTDRYENGQADQYDQALRPDCIAPLDELLTEDITRLMLVAAHEQAIELEEQLNGQFGKQLSVARVDESLVQVMHPRAGKMSALSTVAEHYGRQRNSVMAIGDALNDLGMIQWAGLGVAVHNAHPRVRSMADFITASNDEDGVAEALEMFVIGSAAS